MSDRVRIGAGVALLAVAVVLFVVLRSSGSSDSSAGRSETVNGKPSATVPTIRVKGGEAVGGVAKLQVTAGGRIRFRVRSDIAGEVHVHGYDYEKPIKEGGSVAFDFPAKLEGGFEIEMHHGGGENPIADLKVAPR